MPDFELREHVERLNRERAGLHEQLQFLASECDTLKRQRDEARAAVTTANYVVAEYQSDLKKAEARGYERGVKEAAKVSSSWLIRAGWEWGANQLSIVILALLDKEKTNANG
jgi:chromosome segregation ATPase